MLRSLELKNFTVFTSANFVFSEGLNVFVGANGSGKSHALKAAYTMAAVSGWGRQESGSDVPNEVHLRTAIALKLINVFRPDELGRLVTRQPGRSRCEVLVKFKTQHLRMGFSFHTSSKLEVRVDTCPKKWEGSPPAFIPTRELLSIYPGFTSLYKTSEIPFEETWYDTCVLLGSPLARGPRLPEIKKLIAPLETALGGKVVLDRGRFYVKFGNDKVETHLVAEGLRKLAMIAHLILNGTLTSTGSLFWDEPEANLNPKIIKHVARTILDLCLAGVQVFIGTHSLFLLKEFDILLRGQDYGEVNARFFGLHGEDAPVQVECGDSIDSIGSIDALDEELHQSQRYLESEAS